jgi:hypothetical protein
MANCGLVQVVKKTYAGEGSKDALRGQPFIGGIVTYHNPKDLAFGQSVDRVCGYCFYRAFDGNPDGDCHIEKSSPKIEFGVPVDGFLPPRLDGKEVGNYCKHFVDFRAE